MNRVILSVATAALVLLASQTMAGGKEDNWYFQGLVGKRFLTESDLTLEGTTSKVEISTDGVPSGSAAFGYRFQSFPYQDLDTRFELQMGASESEPKTVEPRGALATRLGTTQKIDLDADNLHSVFGMANAWFDYNFADSWVVSVGGGLGGAFIRYDDVTALGVFLLDDSDVVVAYQGGLSFGYEIITDLVIGLDYRYFATADPELTFGGNWSSEYGSHDLMFGFRYYFW